MRHKHSICVSARNQIHPVPVRGTDAEMGMEMEMGMVGMKMGTGMEVEMRMAGMEVEMRMAGIEMEMRMAMEMVPVMEMDTGMEMGDGDGWRVIYHLGYLDPVLDGSRCQQRLEIRTPHKGRWAPVQGHRQRKPIVNTDRDIATQKREPLQQKSSAILNAFGIRALEHITIIEVKSIIDQHTKTCVIVVCVCAFTYPMFDGKVNILPNHIEPFRCRNIPIPAFFNLCEYPGLDESCSANHGSSEWRFSSIVLLQVFIEMLVRAYVTVPEKRQGIASFGNLCTSLQVGPVCVQTVPLLP